MLYYWRLSYKGEEQMPQEFKPITLLGVNCYLIKTADGGYVLIDTGLRWRRRSLDRELAAAGCMRGNLRLIVLTHGDADHAGNCAYLRDKYGARVALHRGEVEAVRSGDMLASRTIRPGVPGKLLFALFKLNKADRFEPDIYLEDGDELGAYGLDAKVVYLPGHSRGSIGILTGEGDLFCGDLFTNTDKPVLNQLMDDRAAANASLDRLEGLPIGRVYPGHGRPFPMALLSQQAIIGRP
jgi:glyoxylase-like metal-dependent hydrolase (beta-lactamase superfamily II)